MIICIFVNTFCVCGSIEIVLCVKIVISFPLDVEMKLKMEVSVQIRVNFTIFDIPKCVDSCCTVISYIKKK